MIIQAKLALQVASQHGESSWWDDRKKVMLAMDCEGSRLFSYDPATGEGKEYPLAFDPMAIIGCEDGGYVACSRKVIYKLDSDFGIVKELKVVNLGKETNRFNDCKCGPEGAFYLGSMGTQGEMEEGKLYRYTPEGELSVVLDKVAISNGFAWTPDLKTFYYNDTMHNELYAYDFADGKACNKRTIFHDDSLFPDGMCLDADGNLWVACWGSSKVVCVDPASGEILHEVRVEGANRTSSVAFAGEGSNLIFITTSRQGMSEEELAAEPLSGSLFMAEVPAKGTALYRGKF